MPKLEIALLEEIGMPDLFVGRTQELGDLLKWAEKTKLQLSKSIAILARRKKGKTALVQRLFNLIYSKDDPQLVPFFFRIKPDLHHLNDFAVLFYSSLMSQILGFQYRKPDWIRSTLDLSQLLDIAKDDPQIRNDIETFMRTEQTHPNLLWDHARDTPHRLASLKGIRIIQIIDEFQFMNKYLFADSKREKQINVCHSYMAAAESKVAPMIVTGSYIGWLDSVLTYMTSRFNRRFLHALTETEAIETVYNYAASAAVPIRDSTAPYIANVAHKDPFYIAQLILSEQPGKDLTTEAGVRAVFQHETTPETGIIADVWLEYIKDAFSRVNELNAKRMVLYLAKHGDAERSRNQIRDDLKLDLTDDEMDRRLKKLCMADLIARGSSFSRYKGLGDPVFEVVFRKAFGEDIEQIEYEEITADINNQLSNLKRQTAWLKGIQGEYKVRYHLLHAVNQTISLDTLVFNAPEHISLNSFVSMKKEYLSINTEQHREVDIYARSQQPNGCDLIIEVKNWDSEVKTSHIEAFLELKKQTQASLSKKTGYLFYSEKGFSKAQIELLVKNNVMYSDGKKLISYESLLPS